MKILLIGLGSIGRRHLQNILALGYYDVSVVSRSGVLPQEFSALPVYTSLNDALEHNFDTAIICTPTSKHVDTLLPLLHRGTQNIYIEKPISHSLEELGKIETLAAGKNLVVGYDLHFDPGFQKVKELLDSGMIGKVVSVNAQVGQYLPDWRPHEDYRQGMSAKKETGGGVMLDLIHEFDYLHSLLGKVENIAAFYKNSGALEIETEDVADVILQFTSGCIGSIHLDYLQQKLIRNCVITGYNGTILWNLAENKVSWIDDKKVENNFDYKQFERNDRFVAIMKAFLKGNDDHLLTSFTDGMESLKMVLAAKSSSETRQFISMESFNSIPA